MHHTYHSLFLCRVASLTQGHWAYNFNTKLASCKKYITDYTFNYCFYRSCGIHVVSLKNKDYCLIIHLSIVSPTIFPFNLGSGWGRVGIWLLGNLVFCLIKSPHNHLTDTRDKRKIHHLTFPNGGAFEVKSPSFPKHYPRGDSWAYNW